MALGSLSYYFVYNQISLVITQVILGLAEAVQVPAYDALYSRYLDKNEAASEWGDWEAMRYIVTAIVAVIGGYMADSLGFRTLFLFMFMISLVSVFTSLNLFRGKKFLNSS